MQWIIFSVAWSRLGGETSLWYVKLFWNDRMRPRKPEYDTLSVPGLEKGESSKTITTSQGELVITPAGATMDGVTIYSQTDDERIQRAISRIIAMPEAACPMTDSTTWHLVDKLPADHDCGRECEFRNAWEYTDSVVVNMPKARVIHMDNIRAVRNAELAKKDVLFMRAVEAGDTSTQSTIATEKQVLRDIPATFDITTGVTTPVQLKAKWPSELPARE